MSIRRHLDDHAGLIDFTVPPIALPSASVALRAGIHRRFGHVSLCGGNGCIGCSQPSCEST